MPLLCVSVRLRSFSARGGELSARLRLRLHMPALLGRATVREPETAARLCRKGSDAGACRSAAAAAAILPRHSYSRQSIPASPLHTGAHPRLQERAKGVAERDQRPSLPARTLVSFFSRQRIARRAAAATPSLARSPYTHALLACTRSGRHHGDSTAPRQADYDAAHREFVVFMVLHGAPTSATPPLFSVSHAPPTLPPAKKKKNLIFRFLQSRTRVQIWLYEQTDLRIEGQIIVS